MGIPLCRKIVSEFQHHSKLSSNHFSQFCKMLAGINFYLNAAHIWSKTWRFFVDHKFNSRQMTKFWGFLTFNSNCQHFSSFPKYSFCFYCHLHSEKYPFNSFCFQEAMNISSFELFVEMNQLDIHAIVLLRLFSGIFLNLNLWNK